MSDSRLRLPFFAPPAIGDLPAGSVAAYAGQLAPAGGGHALHLEPYGWMLCDGRSLPTGKYPELFAALGYLYGGSDKSFTIPDYTGYFLRGTDSGGVRDKDADKRNPAPGDKDGAKGVGSTQGFAFQQHEHDYLGGGTAGTASPGDGLNIPGAQKTLTTDGGASADSVLTSVNETRPVNISINYIIKVTGALRRTMP